MNYYALTDIGKVRNKNQDQATVIANVKGGIPIGNKGYKGHYVTLLGMDASGQIFLGDPGSTDNSGYYDQSKIFTGAIVGAIIIDN